MGIESPNPRKDNSHVDFQQTARSQPAERPVLQRFQDRGTLWVRQGRRRLNAVSFGLRARHHLLLFDDNPADYRQLRDELEAEWQPQTSTERIQLEQMSTSYWLLARTAESENRVCQAGLPLGKELALLDRVGVQRARLERSFTTAMRELKHLQKERQARQPQPAQTSQTAKPAPAPDHQPTEPQAPPPDYVMSEGPEVYPVFCSPVTPDNR